MIYNLIGYAIGLLVVIYRQQWGLDHTIIAALLSLGSALTLLLIAFSVGVKSPTVSGWTSHAGATLLHILLLAIVSAFLIEFTIYIESTVDLIKDVRVKQIAAAFIVLAGMSVAIFKKWLDSLSPPQMVRFLINYRYRSNVAVTTPGHKLGTVFDDASRALYDDPAALSESRSISGWRLAATIRRLTFVKCYLQP